MILQPCNVELTKIHYYDRTNPAGKLAISTISREVSQNNFNSNVIIKRNVFGQRWVLKINHREDVKKKTRLRVVMYVLVFCSIIVAVCFGIFFSIYKNRYKPTDHKMVHLGPISNTTDLNPTDIYKSHENQITLETRDISRITEIESTTTNDYTNASSTTSSICGECFAASEVCLKIEEIDTPKCVKILDKNDPTGCGGLCPINTHFCQLLDVSSKVYQCSPVKKALACPNDTFSCGNMCISKEKRCDGLVHCSNGSDEENCVCDLETHFHCGNSTSCLEKDKRCDHKVDCWDRSDEMNCTKAMLCNTEEMPCANGQCISRDNFCDGNFDCFDRTDEPEGCQI